MLLVLNTVRPATRNAGDWLIGHSLVEAINAVSGDEAIEERFIREELDGAEINGRFRKVVIAALSIFDDVYPSFMPLNRDIAAIEVPIVPIGCTWQHPVGFPEDAMSARLNEGTRSFFARLVGDGGPIAVRDHQAQTVLGVNDIEATFVGDCALYDQESLGRQMRRPAEIRSVVFTTPHNRLYRVQAAAVLELIAAQFPSASKLISLQSKPGTFDLALVEHAQKLGFDCLHTYADPLTMLGYDRYDLHVGYRLHGHIGFLRKRIPSVLLVEDARGEGFRASFPTGCFSARRAAIDPRIGASAPLDVWKRYVLADDLVVRQLGHFIEQELDSGFRRMSHVADLIDRTYEEAFLPKVQQIAS